MSSEGPLKVYMLNVLFGGGWEGGVGGKVVTLVNVNAPVVATTSRLLHFSAPVVA